MEQVFSEESDEGGGVDETAPPKPSRGPDIEFPLQRKDIDLLIEAFRKKKVSSKVRYMCHVCPTNRLIIPITNRWDIKEIISQYEVNITDFLISEDLIHHCQGHSYDQFKEKTDHQS